MRTEIRIAPSKKLRLILSQGTALDKSRIQDFSPLLCRLAALEGITWVDAIDKSQAYATAVLQNLLIFVPLAGLVDQAAEDQRRAKNLQKLQLEYEKLHQKLSNPNFVDRAPPALVAQEQARLLELEEAIKKLAP